MFYWIVNIVGFLIIAMIIGWFGVWGKKKGAVAVLRRVDITVADGMYSPDTIAAKVGQPITLRFLRRDKTPCAGTVVFSDFNRSLELPVGKTVEITFTPNVTGEYEFTCQMGMYRGKMLVLG
ncbi:MAG: hypothetical protein A3F41_03885 [Coxiella sp. RIFCSPHIGHO2_12_FULL_44_14]|nr:MAG: hypothetical protein A3F41_03885 [Coxiella sp. RIFCSPHIGHO2_12_FULL_44_14]